MKAVTSLSAGVLALAGVAGMGGAAASSKPNFVVLFLDDYGWGDFGANVPEKPSETPNLDALAADGMRFTDFHAMPLCTPSRAQLLTGRLAPRHGVHTNFAPASLFGLNNSEITLAEFLKGHGYATAMRGKWHLGHNPPHHPSYRGFDEVTTVPYSIDMGCVDNSTWYVPPTGGMVPLQPDCLSGNPKTVFPAIPLYNATVNCSGTGNCNAAIIQQPLDLSELSDTYNAEALRFIAATATSGSPFLLYMPFSHTHTPLMTSSRWLNSSTAKDIYHDVIREVDNSVREIIAALKAAGVYDNTYIFATADNGPPKQMCEYAGSPGPFIGAYQQTIHQGSSSLKNTNWEGGHRVFGVIAGPNVPAGSVSHALVSTIDVWPTVASLAGIPLPSDRSYDGEDLSPVLFQGATKVRDFLFMPDTSGFTEGNLTGMRYDNYTIYWQTNGGLGCNTSAGPHPVVQHDPPLVFDLSVDPGQATPFVPSKALLDTVTKARDAKVKDVEGTFRTTVDWAMGDKEAWACCNPAEPDCGCRSASTVAVK